MDSSTPPEAVWTQQNGSVREEGLLRNGGGGVTPPPVLMKLRFMFQDETASPPTAGFELEDVVRPAQVVG